MPASEMTTMAAPGDSGRPRQIASWMHFAGFLLFMAGTAALGFRAQGAATGGATAGQLTSHSKAIYVYLVAGLMDWALLCYCWTGVHHYGGNLATLSGGRWMSWKALAVDVAIAVPFWVLWEAVADAVHRILGSSNAKSVDDLLPRSLVEILIW